MHAVIICKPRCPHDTAMSIWHPYVYLDIYQTIFINENELNTYIIDSIFDEFEEN